METVQIQSNQGWWKKLSLAALLCIIAGAGYWWYTAEPSFIKDFVYERDAQHLLDSFERDRWLLLGSPDYSVEFMMRQKAPDKNPLYIGTMNIKVAYEDGKFVGFVTYYKETVDSYHLLFLVVHPDFRSKGYGQKLLKYALADAYKRGAKRLWLLTRITNYRAQRLYTGMGFKEFKRDEGFVYYEMALPAKIK